MYCTFFSLCEWARGLLVCRYSQLSSTGRHFFNDAHLLLVSAGAGAVVHISAHGRVCMLRHRDIFCSADAVLLSLGSP